MKHANLKKAGLILVSILGCSIVSAGSCGGDCSSVYRTYYTDAYCNSYYTDAMGNRVVEGRVDNSRFVGLPMHQDCNGRWFYQDSFGNRIYKSAHCG